MNEASPPRWVFFLSALATYWFSWADILDGMRARKYKCGTPVGRLIDEAGDPVQYSLFCMMFGYVMKLPPGWWYLGLGLLNLG